MYSDMSKRMSAWSLPNRKLASARASSVLPTPVGPRKMKLPTGRLGFLSPARDRRIARDTAEIAFSWLMTRLWRSDSMRSSLSPSSWLIDVIGTPVHFDTTSSMSARPTITLRALDFTSKRSRTNARFSRAESSSSRSLLRRLEVLLRDRLLHPLHRDADALVDLAELLAVTGFLQLGARAGLVEQVDGLVGQEPVGDVAARLVDRRLDRLARVLDVMELLVAILHAEQDLDRLPSRPADRP